VFRLRIDLAADEMDWLCAWDTDGQDNEIDDPAEEDTPAEHSENLESDAGIRFGADEGTAVAMVQATGWDVGGKVLSLIDRDGRPAKIPGTVVSWRYKSPNIYYAIKPEDGVPFEVDADHVRTRSGHKRPRAVPCRR
jgi:hypothetical protein